MKDFMVKAFKEKRQVFVFLGILLVAFSTFSLINVLTNTPEEIPQPVDGLINDDMDYNDEFDDDDTDIKNEQPQEEKMVVPVETGMDFEVIGRFYDVNASEEERLGALIVYKNVVQNSTSTNYKAVSKDNFNVVSVFSGTVTDISTSILYGNEIEITHVNGLITKYASLEKINVELDQTVKQGDVIGSAGICEIEETNGKHIRLTMIKDDKKVNAEKNVGTKLSEIE